MKLPERIMGFVSLENENELQPFEFDQDSFILKIYPDTDEWKEKNSLKFLLKELYSVQNDEIDWIPSKYIYGKTSNFNNVVFKVLDNPVSYGGFKNYTVDWFFYFLKNSKTSSIDGFKFKGDTINYFYPPEKVLGFSHEMREAEYEEGYKYKYFKVESKPLKAENCGSYKLDENITVDMEITSVPNYCPNNPYQPISAQSLLVSTFNQSVNLDHLLDATVNLNKFLKFVTFRNNSRISEVEVFRLTENKLRDYFGILKFPETQSKEVREKAEDRIIKFESLSTKTGDILDKINNGQISMFHYCDTIADQSHFGKERLMMIFASFESEFNDIYGPDYGLSKHFFETKEELEAILAEYIDEHTGKKKKDGKQFLNLIKNRHNSLQNNILNALKNSVEILRPFIQCRYRISDDEVESVIKAIPARVSKLRNSIAHGRGTDGLEAVNMVDLHIIEELILVMRLQSLGLDKKPIQQSIMDLFGYKLNINTNDPKPVEDQTEEQSDNNSEK